MTTGISRFIPNDYIGPNSNIIPIMNFPRRPTTNDKKYPVGQFALLGKSPSTGVAGELWYLSEFSGGLPQWVQLAVGAGSPGIDTLETDDGPVAVGPDGSGTVQIIGGTGVITSGQDPATTVTIEVDTAVITTSYAADAGTAAPAAGVLTVAGGSNITTSAAGSTVTVDLDANINVTTVTATGAVNAGELNIDPGASGDSFVQFDINSINEFRIGVDDTDDSFRISQGGALGTNDTFIMSSTGERTLPLQPAFAAYFGTADTNVTGDGTIYTVGSGNALTEIYDRGGDFVTTGTFTAPVSGIYILSFSIRLTNVTSGHTSGNFVISTSNRDWRGSTYNPTATLGLGGGVGFTNYCLADMDAGDTATFTSQVSGSTKTVNITAGDATSWVSGALYA